MTHTYREFLGGFSDWVENLVESSGKADYRKRIPDNETVSVWQSLAVGANYKAAYCMGVCPAGEDVIGPFLDDRQKYTEQVVNPLRERVEPVYVVDGTDSADYVAKRYPHKSIRKVGNGLRPKSASNFIQSLRLVFQRGKAEELKLEAVYHFTFTGSEELEATVSINKGELKTSIGHVGAANIKVKADTDTWLMFLAKERSIARALITGKVKIKGSPTLLPAFGKCFPL
jgi:hypothetical protein